MPRRKLASLNSFVSATARARASTLLNTMNSAEYLNVNTSAFTNSGLPEEKMVLKLLSPMNTGFRDMPFHSVSE